MFIRFLELWFHEPLSFHVVSNGGLTGDSTKLCDMSGPLRFATDPQPRDTVSGALWSILESKIPGMQNMAASSKVTFVKLAMYPCEQTAK